MNMKIALIATVCILIPIISLAQEFQINPFASYQLGGKIKFDDAELKFDNGVNFGLGISKGFDGKNVEISYTHFISTANLKNKSTDKVLESSEVHIGYIQGGLVQDFLFGEEKVVPIIIANMGGTYIKLKDFSGTEWGFTLGFGAGCKFFFHDVIGIRVQARFLLPMFFRSYCNWGYCTGSTKVLPQGDFSGGLVLRISN